jgi:primosomal protein N' (replication factor Y)
MSSASIEREHRVFANKPALPTDVGPHHFPRSAYFSPVPNLFGIDDPAHAAPPPGGAWTYLRIAIERGLDQTRESAPGEGLTYRSPTPIDIGRRVEIPLGRGDKPSAGIVIRSGGEELLGGFPAHRVKSILRDTGAGLPPRLVELAQWMATYYVCPLGMVLGSMLPAAVKKRTGLRSETRLLRALRASEGIPSDSPKLSPQTQQAWEKIAALPEDTFPLTPTQLATRIASRTLAPINRLIKLGHLTEIEVEDVRQSGGVETQLSIEQADPTGVPLGVHRPTLTAPQTSVVTGIAGTLGHFGVHLLHGVTGSGKTEVYLRVLEQVLQRGQTGLVLVPEISLTPQTAGRFVERFRTAGVGVLHSGLSASQRHKEWARAASGAARVMVGARSAIFAPLAKLGLIIVDEEHASDYKQDQLPRYHGRDVAIKRASMEACPIILGSATPSLETWSNASGGSGGSGGTGNSLPVSDATVLTTGSKLPMPPKYKLWQLKDRVGGGQLPKVEVVNLAEERTLRRQLTGKPETFPHLIGPTLEEALVQTLDQGGQALLLLNRRGYASYIACPDSTCGWILTCDDCDAKMVQHRVIAGKTPPKGVVRCHHCLAQSLLPQTCPVCAKKLITLGMGTQGLEQELNSKLAAVLPMDDGRGAMDEDAETPPSPQARTSNIVLRTSSAIVRVDGDTMNSAKDYFNVLSRFAKGEIRILVGTQMIAKGLDFPNVRLVGVINADTALSLPDFRASERTFQLVSQVAGRAGRGSLSGRVIVQTFDPSAPAITYAAEHDFPGFAAQELAERRESGLPPASRLARIVIRDLDLHKAEDAANRLKAALESANAAAGNKVRMVGPSPCPISRIASHHRFELLLFSQSRAAIQHILADARAKGLCKSDAHTAIDIDPIALM